ncbi:MAG: hypothetical protein E7462_01325, partial [Ruminococcaceae bacterium]|nr:hypothetical protein [Oscillospiraceae bacterium]
MTLKERKRLQYLVNNQSSLNNEEWAELEDLCEMLECDARDHRPDPFQSTGQHQAQPIEIHNESQVDLFDEIIVDNFAGGGGASTGIELAA